jgi:hypothetical protein
VPCAVLITQHGLEHGQAPFSREPLRPEGAAGLLASAGSPRTSGSGAPRVTGGVPGMAIPPGAGGGGTTLLVAGRRGKA